MAEITITLPDELLKLFVSTLSDHFGYRETVGTDEEGKAIANSQSREDCLAEWIAKELASQFEARLVNKAHEDALATARDTVGKLALAVAVPAVKE